MLITEKEKRKKLNILNRENHVQYPESIAISPRIFVASKNICFNEILKQISLLSLVNFVMWS